MQAGDSGVMWLPNHVGSALDAAKHGIALAVAVAQVRCRSGYARELCARAAASGYCCVV